MKSGGLAATVAAVAIAALLLVGCAEDSPPLRGQSAENQSDCGGEGCHGDRVTVSAGGVHDGVACTTCHGGTGEAHAADPKKVVATIDWTIQACSECHQGEAETYLYDDNTRVGPFGGSVRVPPQPKRVTFPEYDTIVAGHAFAKDYNEEGAHKFMLEDHYETTRGKFETCVQCKSSKLAYAWKENKPLTVAADEKITLTHTAAPGVAAKVVTIPKGTVITYKTDPSTRQVDASAKLPNGTTYSSRPAPSEDATANFNMLWASTIAAIKDTWPYGAGCNHCHDPHSGQIRYLRQAMLQSIEGTGGVDGQGGVNPYKEGSVKDVDKASDKDRRILTCTQCHVEYVCGRSGVDKIDRDAFGWAKAADLHELYMNTYGYTQDWKQAIIGQPLIKSQHPETELYWNSVHYNAGASCGDCHMPEVVRDGRTFRSHWFTSPYKYRDVKTSAKFAEAVGLDTRQYLNPCERCHADRVDRAIADQQAFYAAQAEVERMLAQSVEQLGAIRTAGKATGAAYEQTLDAHRQAHAIWENLAVSENSMGFHNFEESMTSMSQARDFVSAALLAEKDLLGRK